VIGYFGLLLGIALLVSPLAVVDDNPAGPLLVVGFLSFLLTNVWILVIAITMARTRDEPLRAPEPVTQ